MCLTRKLCRHVRTRCVSLQNTQIFAQSVERFRTKVNEIVLWKIVQTIGFALKHLARPCTLDNNMCQTETLASLVVVTGTSAGEERIHYSFGTR